VNFQPFSIVQYFN